MTAQRALDQNPNSGDAHLVLGIVASAEDDLAEAALHFERGVALQPKNPQALSYLGSTYLRQGKLAEALRVLRGALALRTGNATILYNLGLVELASGRPRAALAYFEDVQRAQPADVSPLIGMLECRLILGQAPAARVDVQKIRSLLAPGDPRLLAVAILLAKHSDYETAIPILQHLQTTSPASFEVAYNLSLALSNQRRAAEAAAAIRPFLSGSHAAEANNLLGAIEAVRNKGAALAAYREAVRLDPKNEDYVLDYGAALLDDSKLAESVAVYSEAVSNFPHSARMRIALGCAQYLSDAYKASAETLLEAIRIDPYSKPAFYLLGKSYESAESLQPEIQRAFDRYVAGNPSDPWAFTHYGMILFLTSRGEGRRDFPEARKQLSKAIQQQSNFAAAHYQMGIVRDAEAKIPQAIQSLEHAARLDPQLAEVHYRLAALYRRSGLSAKARTASERFQQLKQASDKKNRLAAITLITERRPTP